MVLRLRLPLEVDMEPDRIREDVPIYPPICMPSIVKSCCKNKFQETLKDRSK